MHGSITNVWPRRRRPRMFSSPARYIQPADPVYQVHPPRPAWRARAYTSPATIWFCLVESHIRRGPRMVHRVQHMEEIGGFVAARVNAITSQVAACVYCPPFSLMPGGYPLDVPRLLRGPIEGRRELQESVGSARDQRRADGIHRALRKPSRHGTGEHRPRLRD